MITNFTSSGAILSKILRDSNIQRTDFINDAVEWMGEALDAIGSFAITEPAVKMMKTYNHSAPLPDGLIDITNVYYGRFNQEKTEVTREDFNIVLPYGDPEGHPAFTKEEDDHPVGVNLATANSETFAGEGETWLLSGNYIKTSFESDWIMISYTTVVTDELGLPMVPDNFSFSQALYWYCIMKMMEGGMSHPAGLNYFHAEERWLKYCRQARSKANMPSYAQALAFKDMWVGLLPVQRYLTQHESGGIDAKNLAVDIFQRYTVTE